MRENFVRGEGKLTPPPAPSTLRITSQHWVGPLIPGGTAPRPWRAHAQHSFHCSSALSRPRPPGAVEVSRLYHLQRLCCSIPGGGHTWSLAPDPATRSGDPAFGPGPDPGTRACCLLPDGRGVTRIRKEWAWVYQGFQMAKDF